MSEPFEICEACGANKAPLPDNTRKHLLGLQERLGRQVTSDHQGPIIIFDGDARLLHALVDNMVSRENKARDPCVS